MGKAKKVLKKVAAKAGKLAGSALAANAAYRALQRDDINVKRIDTLKNKAIKGAIGEKNYKKMIQGTKDLIGEKNYRRANRAYQTGLEAGDVVFQAGKGNFRGSVDALERGMKKGFGEKALRGAAEEYKGVIGEKNYKAIHRIGNRVMDTGLDAASAGVALSSGNYKKAAKYGSSAVRKGIGAEALHKAKRAVRDEIGQKNYDLLNNSYKAMALGMEIGETMGKLHEGYDAGKHMKMVSQSIKLAKQAKKAHGFVQGLHTQTNTHPAMMPTMQQPVAIAPAPATSNAAAMKKMGPIGGVGKPKQTTM